MLSHIWQKIEHIFLLIEIFLESGTQPQCRHRAELRRWWRLRWWNPWSVVSTMTGWTRHLDTGHMVTDLTTLTTHRETLMITWDVMMTRGSRHSLSWSSAVSKWTHKGSSAIIRPAPGPGSPTWPCDMLLDRCPPPSHSPLHRSMTWSRLIFKTYVIFCINLQRERDFKTNQLLLALLWKNLIFVCLSSKFLLCGNLWVEMLLSCHMSYFQSTFNNGVPF